MEAPGHNFQPGATASMEEGFAMTEEHDRDYEKRGTRIMWICSAGILVLILAGMGLNMYLNPDAGKIPTDVSSQTRK